MTDVGFDLQNIGPPKISRCDQQMKLSIKMFFGKTRWEIESDEGYFFAQSKAQYSFSLDFRFATYILS